MLKSVEGFFRNGKVEFLEPPPQAEDGRVLVTFLTPAAPVSLAERGISESQAADLQSRLRTIAEDWSRPEMDAYDAI